MGRRITTIFLVCLFLQAMPGWVRGAGPILVSVRSDGIPADNASINNAINRDGRIVVFDSGAGNLVAGTGPSPGTQVYVKDMATGAVECASCDASGQPGDSNGSGRPTISGDGRYVAFFSHASNLLPGVGGVNAFVYDRATKTHELVNALPDGSPMVEGVGIPFITDSGQYVAFTTGGPGPGGEPRQAYVRDRWAGTTELVSVNGSGEMANGPVQTAVVSDDGRWVAYIVAATNLVPGIGNGDFQAYLYDRQAHAVTCISVDPLGIPGNGDCFTVNISGDGSVVTFVSRASNIVPGDVNGDFHDVFLYDRKTGGLEIISRDVNGLQHLYQGGYQANFPCISYDGSKVVYDYDYDKQVYLFDRTTGTRTIISRDSSGSLGNASSAFSTISSTGNCVCFESVSTNFSPFTGDNHVYSLCLTPPVWPTDTPTATITPTTTHPPAIPTPGCREGRPDPPVVYPNPSKGRVVVRVRANACWDVDCVNVKLVTTAYRVLNMVELGPQKAGAMDTEIELKDREGKPLSNGLYYVLVETQRDRAVGKVIVLN